MNERFGFGIEKQNAVGTAHGLDAVQRTEELVEIPARAYIGDKRHLLVTFGCCKADLGKLRDQRNRQIIHAVVSQILQRGHRAALARAGHPGNN